MASSQNEAEIQILYLRNKSLRDFVDTILDYPAVAQLVEQVNPEFPEHKRLQSGGDLAGCLKRLHTLREVCRYLEYSPPTVKEEFRKRLLLDSPKSRGDS